MSKFLNLTCNLGHNILKLFHVLAKFLFTASKVVLNGSITNIVNELPHVLPSNVKLKKLDN